MRVVINGSGATGMTLAYWLRRSGHEVLLVEKAPRPPTGDDVTDIWGTGYDVAERMGLIPVLGERSFQMSEARFVNGRGRVRVRVPFSKLTQFTRGRFMELRHAGLLGAIRDLLDPGVEWRLGDSVAGIEDAGGCVRVSFDQGPPREADLVVGADGLHSRVRRLVFGPDADFEKPLGYHLVYFEVEGHRPHDKLVVFNHMVPGRLITMYDLPDGQTLVALIFRDGRLPAEGLPEDEDERRQALAEVFARVRWECPSILADMMLAAEVHIERVCQIRMKHWARGRVALVGNAAACPSFLSIESHGLGMARAYVLAGELRAAGDDVAEGLAAYQRRMMPFMRRKQRRAASRAPGFMPATGLGILISQHLNHLLRVPFLADVLSGQFFRDVLTLPDYGYKAPTNGFGPERS